MSDVLLRAIGKTLVILGRILLARLRWQAAGGRLSIQELNAMKTSLDDAHEWFR